jgi:hypothetical protein
MNRTEDLLREALQGRVDHIDYDLTPISAVVSTARGIRRRRRMVGAVAAAAAVVVVVVPSAVVVGRDEATGPLPSDDLPTTTTTSSAEFVRLSGLPRGERPRIAYMDGSAYVSAEGVRTTIPLDEVDNATPYRGGFLVAVVGSDLGPRVVLLDNEMHEVWRRCGQGGFAVSADRLSTAYVTGPCDEPLLTVHLGGTSGMGGVEQTEQLPREIAVPVGVLDGAVVTSALPDQGGWITDFSGESRRIPALEYVGGVSQASRLVSGQLEGRSWAGAIVDVDSGDVLWEAQGWFLANFSPDGTKVIGVQSDRGALTAWGVFDAQSGEREHQADVPADWEVNGVAWEDDQHLLLSATQDSTSAIVRSDLDGGLELATEVEPHPAAGNVFAARP